MAFNATGERLACQRFDDAAIGGRRNEPPALRSGELFAKRDGGILAND